jgi:hypothetical protein
MANVDSFGIQVLKHHESCAEYVTTSKLARGLVHDVCKDTTLKIRKQIFSKMKLRGLVPNSYIYVSESD